MSNVNPYATLSDDNLRLAIETINTQVRHVEGYSAWVNAMSRLHVAQAEMASRGNTTRSE